MPEQSFPILIVIIALAIGFGVVNGFNDAANAIAPAIGSRAVSPRTALAIATVANMAGAITGTLVAKTIGKGILIQSAITYPSIIAALIAIIVWGTFATYLGLPICLHLGFISGLAGGGLASAGRTDRHFLDISAQCAGQDETSVQPGTIPDRRLHGIQPRKKRRTDAHRGHHHGTGDFL